MAPVAAGCISSGVLRSPKPTGPSWSPARVGSLRATGRHVWTSAARRGGGSFPPAFDGHGMGDHHEDEDSLGPTAEPQMLQDAPRSPVVPLGSSYRVWGMPGAFAARIGTSVYSLQEWRPFRARLVALEQSGRLGLDPQLPQPQDHGQQWGSSSSSSSSSSSATFVASTKSNSRRARPPPGPASKAGDITGHGPDARPPALGAPVKRPRSSSASQSGGLTSPALAQAGPSSKGAAPGSRQRPEARASGIRPAGTRPTIPRLAPGPSSWAHALSHPEPGCLLLARGGLGMSFLDRAVVLVTSHDDIRGSAGIVLNKPSPMKAADLRLYADCPGFLEGFGAQRLQVGGQVHLDHVTLLHRYMGLAGAKEVGDTLYTGGLPDAVRLIQAGLAQPHNFHLMIGLSGWAPRQLASEVSRGLWQCVSASPDLVLPRRAPPPSSNFRNGGVGSAGSQDELWARIDCLLGFSD